MDRLRLAAGAAVLAVLSAFPAAAQTVGDYQATLDKVPVPDATPVQVADACKTVSNYAAVMIPQTQSSFSTFLTLVNIAPPVDNVVQKRDACVETAKQKIISFDDKSGAQILTPPVLEDPEKAYATTIPPLPDVAPLPGQTPTQPLPGRQLRTPL